MPLAPYSQIDVIKDISKLAKASMAFEGMTQQGGATDLTCMLSIDTTEEKFPEL